MANEDSFQSLGEDSTSDHSTNRKRKSKAAVENVRTGKSRRWSYAEVDRLIKLLEKRPYLWDAFCKEYHVRKKTERSCQEIENEVEIDLNIGEISLFFPSLYSVSSLFSFSESIIPLFQDFKH